VIDNRQGRCRSPIFDPDVYELSFKNMGALDNFTGRLIDVHTAAAPLVRKQAMLSIISRRFHKLSEHLPGVTYNARQHLEEVSRADADQG
jgi:hypothetical protein